ncbi:MAG: hypothetical protein HZA46_18330 [Planctomycetales bacterium]|nr:hypothetical protein [Planctomycetales bacterium]
MHEHVNRRNFALSMAAAATAFPAAVATLNDPQQTASADEKKDKSSSQIDLILELVKRQYPHPKLDDAALAEIRHDLEAHFTRARELNKFPLRNGDGPVPGFRA